MNKLNKYIIILIISSSIDSEVRLKDIVQVENENAKSLIKMAKECGCDAVKFQKRTIDIVYTKDFLGEKIKPQKKYKQLIMTRYYKEVFHATDS